MLEAGDHQTVGVGDHHAVAASTGERGVVLEIRQPCVLDRGHMRGPHLGVDVRDRRARTVATPTSGPRTSRRSRSPRRDATDDPALAGPGMAGFIERETQRLGGDVAGDTGCGRAGTGPHARRFAAPV